MIHQANKFVINVRIVLKSSTMFEVKRSTWKSLWFEFVAFFTGDSDYRLCQFDDEQDQCRFFYTYHTDHDQLVLRVQKTKSNDDDEEKEKERNVFFRLSTCFICSIDNCYHRFQYLSFWFVLFDRLASLSDFTWSTWICKIWTRTRKSQMGNGKKTFDIQRHVRWNRFWSRFRTLIRCIVKPLLNIRIRPIVVIKSLLL